MGKPIVYQPVYHPNGAGEHVWMTSRGWAERTATRVHIRVLQ